MTNAAIVVTPSTVHVGEPFTVTVTASEPFGLDSISWSIERVSASSHERQLGGQDFESTSFDGGTLDRGRGTSNWDFGGLPARRRVVDRIRLDALVVAGLPFRVLRPKVSCPASRRTTAVARSSVVRPQSISSCAVTQFQDAHQAKQLPR